MKYLRIQFIHVLGDGIRGKGLADVFLYLRQIRMISIGGAGGGIDEAGDF